MASTTERFFERRREWSQRKHEVFQGYVPQYARILGKRRGRVYLVDAFAGAGSYGTGEGRVLGSPLLAAQIAADLAAAKGAYDLRCINVEADKRAFADLGANTGVYAPFVTNVQGRFMDHIDDILKTVGLAPTLFFLDPFGVGGLEWDALAKVGHRSPVTATELLINFNVPKFDRHAGWLDSADERLQEAFKRLLNRITGATAWQQIWEEPLSKEERYRRIAEFYLNRISSAFGMSTAAYPVRTVDGGHLKYYLVFASRNRIAMRIMSSIFYGVEQRYRQDCARFAKVPAHQMSFLDLVPASVDSEGSEEQLLEELQQAVLALGNELRSITFGRLQDRLIYQWFGRAAERHYREVCRRLVRAGDIDGPERGIGEKTVFRFSRTQK